jgi:predicted nucleic acid-binding protein
MPIEITDEQLIFETVTIQRDIAAGSVDSALDHLGESASIALLQSAGAGRLISDDHAARGEARRRGVKASSTVGVVAQLLSIGGCGIDQSVADQYLEVLQAHNRMHVRLKSVDLIAGDMGPWR